MKNLNVPIFAVYIAAAKKDTMMDFMKERIKVTVMGLMLKRNDARKFYLKN